MDIKMRTLHPDAVIPSYAKPGDAGLDLWATSHTYNSSSAQHVYGTGIAMEIPDGFVALVFPRSSCYKTNCRLGNSVGVIDSGYRGEIYFRFDETHNLLPPYEVGQRVGQLLILPHPKINFVEVDELSETSRGSGGFGSSGK